MFVGTNSLGDVNALYNADGEMIVKYEYDAWGKVLAETDANGNALTGVAATWSQLNPFRYRGYVYDAETGLYYLQSRYYDPEVGRFLNSDGLVSTGQGTLGHNMFAYCNNNPIMLVDYLGLSPEVWQWVASSGLVATGIVLMATGVGGYAGGLLLCAGVNSIINSYLNEYSGGSSNAGWWSGIVSGALCGLGVGVGGEILYGAANLVGIGCVTKLGIGSVISFSGGFFGTIAGNITTKFIDGNENVLQIHLVLFHRCFRR